MNEHIIRECQLASESYSDADLEQVCQALLLHVQLHLALKKKGETCLRLCWDYPPFKERLEETLTKLSTENEWGLLRMSPKQAGLVREILMPRPAHI